MKILVTGASGYTGSKLTEELLNMNHEVYSILNKTINERINYINLDELYNYSFDLIYHIAAFPDKHNNLTENIIHLVESNVLFSAKILSYARDKNIKFISTSSYSQYEDNSVYVLTKNFVEDLAKTIQYDNVAFVRLTDTYGEDDKRMKVFNVIKKAIENNEKILLQSSENKKINFTHIKDVVRALIHLGFSNEKGIFDLIYSSSITTLGEMARKIDPSGKHYEFKSKEIIDYKIPTNLNRIKDFELSVPKVF